MKSSQKRSSRSSKTAFSLSIILHGFIVILFIIINVENSKRKSPGYFIINFLESSENKTEVKVKKEINKQRGKFQQPEKNNFKEIQSVQKKSAQTNYDTTAERSPFTSLISDSTYDDLSFARSLLDTFLVRHPEYSKLILKEQAKDLKDKKLSGQSSFWNRETLEKKLNEEIHKYLSSKFPEGSEHALNKYTGPGLQIPIGDLIDLVKKIFK